MDTRARVQRDGGGSGGELSSVRYDQLSWQIDPNVAGASTRIVAVDEQDYHQEILTLPFDGAAFRLASAKRVLHPSFVSRRVEVVGDVDGDGFDDVAVRGREDADDQPSLHLFLGSADPFDVLAPRNSIRWAHTDAEVARPKHSVVSHADRSEEDRIGRAHQRDVYGDP